MAGVLGTGLVAGAVVAQEPTPNTFVDVSVPQLTGWNEVNRLTVDGISGATAKTYIYTDADAKAAAEAEGGDWDLNSPAQVYWELDDGSGRAPGIQVVTDDFDFPTNNCIMASGEREADDFEGTIVPKTCSDAASSSKRFFLEIVDADTPVDMVFDVGMKDIRYGGVKNPEDDGGEALEAFREEYGIGRIYRVIQKVINNSDERWVGINVELGHGVGDDFQRFNFAEDGVAFELRNMVPREFFEGETGAPDIEVWVPERYATFSPKAFDDGSRERFPPGFFDDEAAGMFPPQDASGAGDKTPFIFSGTDGRADGAYGAITPNHFSMVDNQAAGSTVNQGVFGYLLSDSLAPYVIARYDEGDPEGESDALEAWWDGTQWRYGLAGNELDSAGPFDPVSDSQLTQWAVKLLGIEPIEGDTVRYDSILADDLATQNMDVFIYISDGILDETGVPKYDNITLRVTGVSTDDANIATTELGNNIPDWLDEVACDDPEDAGPCYQNNFTPLYAYYDSDAPVALNDLATTYEQVEPTDSNYDADALPLNIPVLDNDVFNGELLSSDAVTVNSITVDGTPLDAGAEVDVVGDEGVIGTVQLNEEGALPSVDFTPEIGFTGLATFKYTVNAEFDDGVETKAAGDSNEATVSVRVNAYPDPDQPVAANDSAVTYKNTPVTIDVLANDTLPGGTPTVEILDNPLTGDAVVEEGKVVYTPAADYVGLDRFTYTVTTDGNQSNAALITVRVDEEPEIYVPPEEEEAESRSSSSGGCSYNPGAPFDPTLLLLALAAIGGVTYRNRRKAQQL